MAVTTTVKTFDHPNDGHTYVILTDEVFFGRRQIMGFRQDNPHFATTFSVPVDYHVALGTGTWDFKARVRG